MALSPVMTDLTLALALALDMIDLKRNDTVTNHDRPSTLNGTVKKRTCECSRHLMIYDNLCAVNVFLLRMRRTVAVKSIKIIRPCR